MADSTPTSPDSPDTSLPAGATPPGPAEDGAASNLPPKTSLTEPLSAAATSGFRSLPPPQPFATMRSENGRVVLTNDKLEINGQAFGWWELESVDVQRVRWLLWLLLGGFTLAGFLLGFLQNWLRTMPAALGMVAGALLLAVGQRGTNRLRLHRLGREAAHFALSGELAPWQKLTAEINRRLRQRHHEAAEAATASLLAAVAAADAAATSAANE